MLIGNLAWYHPYALAYYNPLFGGSATAVKTILVGWGEGLDLASQFIRSQAGPCDVAMMSYFDSVTSAYTPCDHVYPMQDSLQGLVDESYIITYITQLQRGIFSNLTAELADQVPAYVAHIHGIDYADVYRADGLKPALTPPDGAQDMYIFNNAENDDAVDLQAWTLDNDVRLQPCASITVESWWQIGRSLDEDYSMTLVIADQNGQGVVRTDGPIAGVTSKRWQVGQHYLDKRSLTVPCDMPPGEYPLLIGLYQPYGVIPVPVSLPTGAPLGDLLYLTTLFVGE